MKTKRFDCVDIMHRGAARIYAATKGMSRKAELEFWQVKTRELLPNIQPTARHVTAVHEAGAVYRVSR